MPVAVSLDDQKTAARKAAFQRRRDAKSPERDAQAVGALRDAVQPFKSRAVAGYMPIRTEVDPLPVMAELAEFGPVCVPVILGAGQALEFREWLPGCEMVAGPFGAAIPKAGRVLRPELVIVPLVAFTRGGGRLGYGGGFYDRTLEAMRGSGPVTAYGYAFAAQEAAELPLEPTDQTLDAIVTERGIFKL